MGGMTATLTYENGYERKLDAQAVNLIEAVLRAFGLAPKGEAPADLRLTTGQAAEIMGTSAKTIARLIDSGRLPGRRAASGHRTVMLSDLMAYDREARAVSRAHVERARELAGEAGLYGGEYAGELAAYLAEFE